MLRLVAPSLERLPGYEAALAAGWSPNTERDASAEQLALLRRDPRGLVDELTRQDGAIRTGWGDWVPRLPSRTFWLDDDDFCGSINLRYDPSGAALPQYVNGHIGYAVVPWKRRRGYATRALALILPVARAVGLRRVQLTCDDDNDASRRVILANGGVADGSYLAGNGKIKLSFWIALE
jgi:predicted acetyltransferase